MIAHYGETVYYYLMKNRLCHTLYPGEIFVLEPGIQAVTGDESTAVVKSYYDTELCLWVDLDRRVVPGLCLIHSQSLYRAEASLIVTREIDRIVELAPHPNVAVVFREEPFYENISRGQGANRSKVADWKGICLAFFASW